MFYTFHISQQNICVLSLSQIQCMIDGTFSLVPKPFYQMLTIMVWEARKKVYVPAYWALMNSKFERHYLEVFRQIVDDTDGAFNPSVIGLDFELGLIGAARTCWPDAKLIG